MNKEYFAFISYQRQDEEWAKWLADQLEHYHLPLTLNGRDDLPKNLRPIFRDIDELAAGNLPQQIHQALENSKNLIVICSPNSAKSPWVNKEVETFIGMGKLDNIFPFIIDGVPFSKNKNEECLPEALRKLSDDKERLGANVKEYKNGPQRLCKDCPFPKDDRDNKKQGDINEKGRDAAVVKIVAGMLGLGFDTLWQRYEKEKAEEERKIREQRDNLLRVQSRFVAEKAAELVESGDSYLARRLILAVLPNKKQPDWPFTIEAEVALRKASLYEMAVFKIKNDYIKFVKLISFSPNGKYIILDNNIWDAKSGLELKSVKEHSILFRDDSYSPDGKSFVKITKDDTIMIYDAESEKELMKLEGHPGRATSASFSPDGKRIVVRIYTYFDLDDEEEGYPTTEEDTLLYDVNTGRKLEDFWRYKTIDLISFSADGKKFLTTSKNRKSVFIWDAEVMRVLKELKGHTMQIKSATFSSDGKRIVSTSDDRTIRIWDFETGLELSKLVGHTDTVLSASFSPDGQRLVSISKDNTIRMWDIGTPTELRYTKPIRFAALSPDGKCIVSAYDINNVIMWNTETGQELWKYENHTKPISSPPIINTISFSPDGKRIILTSEDSSIRIWDTEEGRKLRKIKGHTKSVNSASFSPDGMRIVSTSDDMTIRIWDSKTGKELRKLEGHTKPVLFASFSPDGKRVVSASLDKSVIIWDEESGQKQKIIEGHAGVVRCVLFSPDAKRVVSTSNDRTIRVWDSETGQELSKLEGHTDSVLFASFSLDGKYVVSSSLDKSVRIWNADDGQELQIFEGHAGGVRCAYFSPDGKQVVSASQDMSIRIWDFLPIQELINLNYERFESCPLNPEERRKYYLD